MTTGSIIALDIVIAVLAAASWLAAGATAATTALSAAGVSEPADTADHGRAGTASRRRLAIGLAVVAVIAILARVVTTIVLIRAGWWFAAEKVLIAGPLALAALLVAGPRVVRWVKGGRPPVVALLFAGYAQTAAVLVTVLHGYPVSSAAVLLAFGGVGGATMVTWRLAGPPPGRAVSRAPVVVTVAVITAGLVLVVAQRPAPAVPHAHGSVAEPAVAEPTRRFTLTAGTATVRADGREIEAWAFNGQVPGPPLTATVGDVLEVTLRNRDIDRGVTLHWHGYDVPNSQDGVPGVTQAAVLPGEEFVYRFQADQAGTYWYHTHAVSDIGVRKGLYGALVVQPSGTQVRDPAARGTGIEVIVPVHTLDGRSLPEAVEDTADAGTPVRLRLINTDSTTHRYALTGAAFRVAAVDGVDLNRPSALLNTAVLIPAGGRYDLTFTAPATPVGLFVDGRVVWSTGPVAVPPQAWPVLDLLTYGGSVPNPLPRADREFTLVLDRGLDMHGFLPRYAHTVNGAADPDIAPQVVRSGESVVFTIVNRSLVVHPWHLHGHHVLVLSRDGERARGSPLLLDSFDVRPGEVWKVAFRADNPGMWANHCHNLAHADQGMILHLLYG
ncbi:multicopper oxidase family protein [Actinoplanes sp. DH11]|uniref:multicopper oxidase family protein n=1 Tax=Actinoplanes sp. DH11 TaxID=2857011 RepID=UPI001E3CB9FA|nr:multicopper oxidase family protein [Actinoplanes sp. DH11]